jgi:hypothetical protein
MTGSLLLRLSSLGMQLSRRRRQWCQPSQAAMTMLSLLMKNLWQRRSVLPWAGYAGAATADCSRSSQARRRRQPRWVWWRGCICMQAINAHHLKNSNFLPSCEQPLALMLAANVQARPACFSQVDLALAFCAFCTV